VSSVRSGPRAEDSWSVLMSPSEEAAAEGAADGGVLDLTAVASDGPPPAQPQPNSAPAQASAIARKPRRTWLFVGAIVALLAVLGLAAGLILTQGKDPSASSQSSSLAVSTAHDATPPTIQFGGSRRLDPQGTTIRTAVSIRDDVEVTKLEFRVNGLLQTEPVSLDYVVWEAKSGPGVYTLEIVAFDSAGHSTKKPWPVRVTGPSTTTQSIVNTTSTMSTTTTTSSGD
jgi:hypothetical protein